MMKAWKYHPSCVAMRSREGHVKRVRRMATKWLETATGDLRVKVLDILHWDYDWKPYTLDDLLAVVTEPSPEILMAALMECGYTKKEAFLRCTYNESRKKDLTITREGLRYRTRKSCRGAPMVNEVYTKSSRDRRNQNYLDVYSVNVPVISPTIYRPHD